MDNPKNQLISRLKEANNVLVTVSNNPSVDQLSAAIGLSLFLNRLGKHATAVFSGEVPSVLEFLQPDKTLEKTTDSLRDFIISLDKSKADKLRYKVEDQHVKIFITPYRTSLSDKDLEFSQGDFNVDVVLALGVKNQKELDQAITAHGRILHDATVVSVTKDSGSKLGSINWVDGGASSLSEMTAALSEQLQENSLDGQMATAFLTGIVSETARFSNEKTTSTTMSVSAKLMAAGANQQLVASQLQPKAVPAEPATPVQTEKPTTLAEEAKPLDGSLQVDHEQGSRKTATDTAEEPGKESEEEALEQIDIDQEGYLKSLKDAKPAPDQAERDRKDESDDAPAPNPLVLEPPMLGGTLTANSRPEDLSPSTDPMSLPPVGGPLLSHDDNQADEPALPDDTASSPPPEPGEESAQPLPPAPENTQPQTLTELEEAVDSPHLQAAAEVVEAAGKPPIDEARDAVSEAIQTHPIDPLEPVAALNAQPIDLNPLPAPPLDPLMSDQPSSVVDTPAEPEFSLPPNLAFPDTQLPPDVSGPSVSDPTAPPPVPPPMMPPLPGVGFDPYAAGLPPLPQEPTQPPLTDEQLPQRDEEQPPANPQNPFNLPPA